MRKLIGEAFKSKCEALMAAGGNIHTVARKLKCSPSTVYRATGGKKRSTEGDSEKWIEKTRVARTSTGRANGVGVATKKNLRKAKTAQRRNAAAKVRAAKALAPKKNRWTQKKRKLTPRAA